MIIERLIAVFYNLLLAIFKLILPISSLISKKLSKFQATQKTASVQIEELLLWRQKLKNRSLVWIHCASLGEFEQARPVIDGLKLAYPEGLILLSFFSSSGYEIRNNYRNADKVVYLPLDTRYNASAFIAASMPTVAIFVKYEFWPNYLFELKKKNVPTLAISVILRPNHYIFKSWAGYFRKALSTIKHFFVQDTETQNLLKLIGINHSSACGDTRFDQVLNTVNQRKPLDIIEKFAVKNKTLVIGSAWQTDLEVLVPYLNTRKDLKVIIAPHEIDELSLQKIKSIASDCMFYSQYRNESEAQYLIIDNIGMLSSIYYYATYVYIGGAFGKGLHNTLEAAAFGKPLFFGNLNYEKFKEATDLINQNVAFPIVNTDDFKAKFEKMESSEILYNNASNASADYVNNNAGATILIFNYLKKLF